MHLYLFVCFFRISGKKYKRKKYPTRIKMETRCKLTSCKHWKWQESLLHGTIIASLVDVTGFGVTWRQSDILEVVTFICAWIFQRCPGKSGIPVLTAPDDGTEHCSHQNHRTNQDNQKGDCNRVIVILRSKIC